MKRLLVLKLCPVKLLTTPLLRFAVLAPKKNMFVGDEIRSVFIVLVSISAPVSAIVPKIVPPMFMNTAFFNDIAPAVLR
jgi:hypothetical protein